MLERFRSARNALLPVDHGNGNTANAFAVKDGRAVTAAHALYDGRLARLFTAGNSRNSVTVPFYADRELDRAISCHPVGLEGLEVRSPRPGEHVTICGLRKGKLKIIAVGTIDENGSVNLDPKYLKRKPSYGDSGAVCIGDDGMAIGVLSGSWDHKPKMVRITI